MGTTYDSSFVIDLLNGEGPALRKSREHESDEVAVFLGAPVLYEVLSGILHRQSRAEAAAFRAFVGMFPILAFGEPAARRAADVRAEFLKLGRAKPGVDVMIAGIALEGDHVLVTRDRDFDPIGTEYGLQLERY